MNAAIAAVSPPPTPIPPSIPVLPDPAVALAASSVLPVGFRPRLLREIIGGEVESFVYAGVSGPIWVQRIADPADWGRATAGIAAIHAAWDAPHVGGIQTAFPIEIAPGTFATALPEPVENVADSLLRAVFGVAQPETDLDWLAPLCHRLGAYARTHALERAAAVPVPLGGSRVVATVAHLLAGAPGAAPRTIALARTIAASPRLVRALQDAVRTAHAESEAVPLHGRFGPAAILRAPGSGTAFLTGWLDVCAGPAVFEAGYLIGELAECATVARLVGRPALAAVVEEAIRAFAAGYAGPDSDSDPARLAARLADIAALKIVEHVARFTRHFGDAGPSAHHLLGVAESLGDPDGWLIQSLSSR